MYGTLWDTYSADDLRPLMWVFDCVCFRCGALSHNLHVETGKYDKIPLEERIYPLCSGNKIEDETHLLLDCQRYSSMGDIFLSKIETKIDEIRKLSHENLISQLMNSNDYYVNLRLIMFI